MELYKEEKVNPLAGCLPTFLQIPIFYALYKVLMLTIEMRHQPFVAVDQGSVGARSADARQPVRSPAFRRRRFLASAVLAILLGISMWLQFKLNPAPMDRARSRSSRSCRGC